MDHELNLRRLRRELALVDARSLKPVRIGAAAVPWWVNILLPKAAREIVKSARSVERTLNAVMPRPKTREDYELLGRDRSPEEIRADIRRIPVVRARCVEIEAPDLSAFDVRRFWYRYYDRYEDRPAGLYVASAPPAPAQAALVPFPAQDTSPGVEDSKYLHRHDDERDRTSREDYAGMVFVTLSRAAEALLLADFKEKVVEHANDHAGYLLIPARIPDRPVSRPLAVALVPKTGGGVRWYEIVEERG